MHYSLAREAYTPDFSGSGRLLLISVLVLLYGGLGGVVLTVQEHGPTYALIYGLGLLLSLPLFRAVLIGRIDILEPIYIVNASYFLYFVFAPTLDLISGNRYFFGKDIFPILPGALLVATLGILCMTVGYYVTLGRWAAVALPCLPTEQQRPHEVRVYGLAVGVSAGLLFAGYVAMSPVTWLQLITLGQFGASSDAAQMELEVGSSFKNYLYNAVNCLAASLVILYAFPTRRRAWWFVGFCAVFLIYTTLGFRYRILILVLSPLIYGFLRDRKRPKLLHVGAMVILVFLVVGGVGSVRNKLRTGDSIDEVSAAEMWASFSRNLNIYQPFAAVVDAFPQKRDFLLGQSYAYLLIQPVPRALWQEKPLPPVYEIIHAGFGGSGPVRAGVAYPNMGEMYADFGILGVTIGMLLFGIALRVLREYWRQNERNRWARIFYAITLPFLVQIVSRGFFVAIAYQFVFFLGPVVLGMWIFRSRSYAAR